MNKKNGTLTLLHDLIDKAAKAGADGADAVFVERVSLSLTQRLGEMEHLERSEGADLGLRVFVGSRQAIVSSSDTSETALEKLVDRAVAMARSVPEDSYCGLADPEQLADDFPDLEVCDDAEPDSDMLSERAARAEEAALGVSGVTNSEGAEAGWGRNNIAMVSSNGFAQTRFGSSHSISVSVVAGENAGMDFRVQCLHPAAE